MDTLTNSKIFTINESTIQKCFPSGRIKNDIANELVLKAEQAQPEIFNMKESLKCSI